MHEPLLTLGTPTVHALSTAAAATTKAGETFHPADLIIHLGALDTTVEKIRAVEIRARKVIRIHPLVLPKYHLSLRLPKSSPSCSQRVPL